MVLAAKLKLVGTPDYLVPVLVGFGLPALAFGSYLASRVIRLTRPPNGAARPPYTSGHGPNGCLSRLIGFQRTPTVFASTTSVAFVSQPKAPPGLWFFDFFKGPTKQIAYRPKPRQEFIFWEESMQSMVTDIRLFDFCRIAWRRQQQVDFGNLGANRIFSRTYFTQKVRPRWPLPDYQSVMHILTSRELVTNRWQGKGGRLNYGPYSTVEEAKLRWPVWPLPPEHLPESRSELPASTTSDNLYRSEQVQLT